MKQVLYLMDEQCIRGFKLTACLMYDLSSSNQCQQHDHWHRSRINQNRGTSQCNTQCRCADAHYTQLHALVRNSAEHYICARTNHVPIELRHAATSKKKCKPFGRARRQRVSPRDANEHNSHGALTTSVRARHPGLTAETTASA
jgi:hypothetical protein